MITKLVRLSAEACIGLVAAIAIVLMDKAGKFNSSRVIGASLLIIAALLLHPSIVTILATQLAQKWKIWWCVAASSTILLVVSAFGIWVWPRTHIGPDRRDISLRGPAFTEKVERLRFQLGEGGIGVGVPLAQLEHGTPKLFELNGYEPVHVSLVEGRLLFTFKVFDHSGAPPIEVRNNEFVVRQPDWDRNSSDNALEVVDEHGIPVFQMIRKTPDLIAVNGIFPLPGGVLAVAGPTGFWWGMREVPPFFRLRPIFKYPSWRFPGQYVEPVNP